MSDFQVRLKDGKQYTVKLLSVSTIEDLTKLFNATKKHKETIRYFTSKYLTNYIDISFQNYLLYDAGIAIGFSGVTFNHLKNKHKEIVIGQLGDVLVHPNYRGIGAQSYLLNLAAETCVKNNIDGLLALPNSQAEPIFSTNDDWTLLTSFYIFSFTIDTYPLLKGLNRLHLSELFILFFKWINKFKFKQRIKWFSGLYKTEKFYPLRSESFFRYKSYKNYTISESNGVKFIWSLDDGIVIGDWENRKDLPITTIHQLFQNYCQKRGIHMLRYVTTGDNLWCEELTKLQKPFKSLNIYYRCFNESLNLKDICLNSFDRNAY
jgi:GNAT superfamily N-acetyltransferase